MSDERLANPPAKVWVEVNLGAIRHNFRQVCRLVEPARLMPVVKSEAYGHGLLAVSRVVLEEGAWGLGVVTVEEGVRLRVHNVRAPILVLGPVVGFEMGEAIEADLTLALFDLEQARELSRQAQARGRQIRVHAKIDTGLGRLSTLAEHAVPFAQAIRQLPGIVLEGVYSHFADAEGLDQSYTLLQFSRFDRCLAEMESLGIRPPLRHISGSAAAMLLREARMDLVRLGIALYGLWPAEETRLLMLSRGQDLLGMVNAQFSRGAGPPGQRLALGEFLKSALSFKTLVVQTKTVPARSCIGYGCTYETQRDTRIAVLPVGYAEGFDRHLSNVGEVLIRGRRARVLGRVCMNMTVVDVTDIPEASVDDEAVIIGSQGDACVRAEEVADKVGTIHYEIVTRIPAHIPRVYHDEKAPLHEAGPAER